MKNLICSGQATISKEIWSCGFKNEKVVLLYTEYKEANICSAASILISLSRGTAICSKTNSRDLASLSLLRTQITQMYPTRAAKPTKAKIANAKNPSDLKKRSKPEMASIWVIWVRNKDREARSLEFVLLQVAVPRDNEIKIDAAEQMFASLYSVYKST